MSLSFRSEKLSEEITAETCCRVKGSKSKDRDSQCEQVVDKAVALLTCEGSKHGCNTTGKDRRRSGKQILVAAAGIGLAPYNTDSDEGDNTESRLNNHGAVADDLSIFLIVDLLGGSTGGDQGVEAGAGAAGNRDEQEREERLAGRVLPSVESRSFNGCCACKGTAKNSDDSNGHHTIEQEGAQVVTRLEQNPDWQQGCNRDVYCNEDNPEGTAEVESSKLADNNNRDDADNTSDGGRADRSILAVHKETEDCSNDDKEDRCHCSGAVCSVGGS